MASKKLSKATVERAVADAAAGQTYNVNDAACPGLELRVAPRGAVFSLRTSYKRKEIRLRLAGVDLLTLDQARAIVSDGMLMLREKRLLPDAGWVRHKLIAIGVVAKAEEAVSIPRKALTWTYAQAVTFYLEEVKRTRREATWRDRRGMLQIAELKPFADRLVGSIGRREIATIVADIHRSGRERHAAHLCEAIRPMWSWLAGDAQQIRSGVLGNDMSMLRPPEKTNREAEEPDTYVPPPAELGRLLAIAQANVVDEVLADALLLTLYTAQRRRSVVNARLTDFVEEADGGLTWAIAPIHRKTGRGKRRTHDLPLPATPAAMVRRRIAAAAADEQSESVWLFPARRPRRAGDEVSHVHADSLTHLLDALPGSEAAPHDIRRGFTTHLEDLLGVDQSELKLVLDHSEGKAAGDVTEKAYSRARRLAKKQAILEPWAALLEKDAAAARLGDLDALGKAITEGYKRQKTKKVASQAA